MRWFFHPWQEIPEEDGTKGDGTTQDLGKGSDRPASQGREGRANAEPLVAEDAVDGGCAGSDPLDSQEQWVCVSGGEGFPTDK